METYSLLRHFADSWMLLAMTLFFLGVVLWVFRPGSRALQRDAAEAIFRHDQKPASTGTATAATADRFAPASPASKPASKEV